MDPITHALSGMLLGRATARRAPRENAPSLKARTWICTIAAAFPDIDIVLRLTGDSLGYLNGHRGLTHSLLMMPLWALILAMVISALLRRRYSWRSLYGLCVLGIGIHILGDVITSYGTGVFEPISDWRVSFPLAFIIDPYMTFIIVLPLVLSFWKETQARWITRAGMAALIGYVGGLSWLHDWAQTLGRQQAEARGWKDAAVVALPQPFSPLNQKIVVIDEERYHLGLMKLPVFDTDAPDLNATGLRAVLGAYRSPEAMVWEDRGRFGQDSRSYSFAWTAWSRPEFESYRRFARFPALDGITASGNFICAHFVDLRFTIPGFDPPFRYGICREPEGWQIVEPISGQRTGL